jgi:hypothetical protein
MRICITCIKFHKGSCGLPMKQGAPLLHLHIAIEMELMLLKKRELYVIRRN